MSFEVEGRDIIGIPVGGASLTPEAAAIEKAAREQGEAEKAAFLAERRREMAKQTADEQKAARERAEENLEQSSIEIFMTANPSYSFHDAKFLYDTELRKIIAIRRFEAAFFVEKPKADFHM
jgi:hypothetical protein